MSKELFKKIEIKKKKLEDSIKHDINLFIAETGVKLKSISLEQLWTSANGEMEVKSVSIKTEL